MRDSKSVNSHIKITYNNTTLHVIVTDSLHPFTFYENQFYGMILCEISVHLHTYIFLETVQNLSLLSDIQLLSIRWNIVV
jgi:hypothetical protein